MTFESVRENAQKGYGRVLTKRIRGIIVWKIDEAVKAGAARIGISFNGDTRKARMALAKVVFLRDAESYNDLSDNELQALNRHLELVTGKAQLDQWMRDAYGYTLKMELGCEQTTATE